MPEIPEPDRAGGVIYVCRQRTDDPNYGDRCGHPFIFRSSYERHWRDEHAPSSVDYEPDAMQGQRILGGWVDEAQLMPLVALSADPRNQPLTASPEVFSELDRKQAAARLDTYLQTTGHGDAPAYAEWMGMPNTVGTLELAHDVDVQRCCPDPACRIRYHYCRVCEIVTLQPPPLPCPGPREDG